MSDYNLKYIIVDVNVNEKGFILFKGLFMIQCCMVPLISTSHKKQLCNVGIFIYFCTLKSERTYDKWYSASVGPIRLKPATTIHHCD